MMTDSMNVSELNQAQTMIDAGDLAGFYSFMANQGYNYAILAAGLVKGSSFSGAAATNYLLDSAKAQGVDFGAAQLPALESKMATAWVDALIKQAVSTPAGTVSADLSYQQTLLFHKAVFLDSGLSVDAWTLAVPGEVLSASAMESWTSMLDELRNAPIGPLVSGRY
jgi:hypothetical protein